MEDYFWLARDYKKGEVLYRYHGYTYGIISDNGVAVSEVFDLLPFFEVPLDAVFKGGKESAAAKKMKHSAHIRLEGFEEEDIKRLLDEVKDPETGEIDYEALELN